VWLPGTYSATPVRIISLGELAGRDVIHGPCRIGTVPCDPWPAVILGQLSELRLHGPAVPAVASKPRARHPAGPRASRARPVPPAHPAVPEALSAVWSHARQARAEMDCLLAAIYSEDKVLSRP
jgi:hypothetical protein